MTCKDCIKEYHKGELKERLRWQHVRMKVEALRDEADKGTGLLSITAARSYQEVLNLLEASHE